MKTNKCSMTMMGALCLAGLLAASGASAQVKRTEVSRADVTAPNHEAVVMKVELDAGKYAGRHTHPGDEISYIFEGESELLIDGEAPRRVKAGEAIVIKAGTVHDVRNTGKTPVRLIGVYVVEKGKPLASPAR